MRTYTSYSLAIALLLLVQLVACTPEPNNVEEIESTSVELSLWVAPMEATNLRSNQLGDTEQESTVKSLVVFAQKVDGTLWKKIVDENRAPTVSGLLQMKLDLEPGRYRFYAIANASDELINSISNKDDLDRKIISSSETLAAPFIMTGETGEVQVASNVNVAMQLKRVVARLDLSLATAVTDFTLESVQLFKANRESYLFPRLAANATPNQDGWPAVATPNQRVTYDVVTPSSNGIVAPIYLFEAFNRDANKYVDNVSLIVKGTYQGTEGYYKIDVRDFRGRQWIRRNGLYKISIEKVLGYGYATQEQALNNKPANMVLGIANREEADTESSYIVFDGEEFLGTTSRDILVNNEGESDLSEIAITSSVLDSWNYKVPADASWITAQKQGSKLSFTFTALSNNADRGAIVSITIPSRPNLELKIKVEQRTHSSYYNRLDVSPTLFVSNGKEPEIFFSEVASRFVDTQWMVESITDSYEGAGSLIASTKPAQGIPQDGSTKQLMIQTAPLPKGVFYREAYVKLTTIPKAGEATYSKVVRVVSGLELDYIIQYPEDSSFYEDLRRTKRVIETPLDQEKTYTYTIQVKSAQNWRVVSSHPWIKVTQPVFKEGSYNTTFTVSVDPNPGNGNDIGGLKKAREGYVDIQGDQASKRIMVYQGGYVVIGQDTWMDRNLRHSRYKANIPRSNSYADLSSSDKTLAQMLYPAAVPIAFPASMTACYGNHRSPTKSTIDYLTSILRYLTGQGYYYNHKYSSFNPYSDGYYGWGQPGAYMVYNDGQFNSKSWDLNYNIKNSLFIDNSKKGLTDPCPEGWRTPSYAELNRLGVYMNEHRIPYNSGVEHLDTPRSNEDKNNGLYFYNKDNVSCWFPFAGFRNSKYVTDGGLRFTSIRDQGKSSRYYVNNTPDSDNAFSLQFYSDKVDMLYENLFYGNPIRCIKE